MMTATNWYSTKSLIAFGYEPIEFYFIQDVFVRTSYICIYFIFMRKFLLYEFEPNDIGSVTIYRLELLVKRNKKKSELFQKAVFRLQSFVSNTITSILSYPMRRVLLHCLLLLIVHTWAIYTYKCNEYKARVQNPCKLNITST